MFHTVTVRLIKNFTLLFLTGEDDIARFDSRQYSKTPLVEQIIILNKYIAKILIF
jgi:hypothetical protein